MVVTANCSNTNPLAIIVKKILYILILLPLVGICQKYERIISVTDTIYILTEIDSLEIPKNLPDGKWVFNYPDVNENIKAEFYLKQNKINGEFKYWSSGGLIANGCYLNDSLWTFYKPNGFHWDTTFMTGLWFYHHPFGWETKKYKISFENNDTYVQILTDEKNRPHSVHVWHQNQGLIQETWYEDSKKKYEYIKAEKYSLLTKWTDDEKIQSIEIIQDSLIYQNNLIRSERFYNNVGISIKTLDKYQNTDIEIPVIEIKTEGKEIKDVKVNDSSFNLEYLKMNGKRKYKRIK